MANENEVFEFDNIEPVPIVSKNRNLAVSYLQKKSIDDVMIRPKKNAGLHRQHRVYSV